MPTNVIYVGATVVARSLVNLTRTCYGPDVGRCATCCQKNEMPGYVTKAVKLGNIYYEDYGSYSESSYQLATCHPPTLKPWTCIMQ